MLFAMLTTGMKYFEKKVRVITMVVNLQSPNYYTGTAADAMTTAVPSASIVGCPAGYIVLMF